MELYHVFIMKIQHLACIVVFFCLTLQTDAQTFRNFINRVNSIPEEAGKAVVVDSFMDAAEEFPFIEADTATFIYRGLVSSVSVPGDFNGWSTSQDRMVKLDNTNFWYVSKTFEANARLDYKIVRNGNTWILDPLNPNIIVSGFGPNSELAMPDYEQPWEIKSRDVPKGTLEVITLSSSHTGTTYQIGVYLPPSYAQMLSKRYPVAYFQDGLEYLDLAEGVNILNNLIDSSLCRETIAVFVVPDERGAEYAFDLRNQYRQFFVQELVPHIDSGYRTIAEASERAVIGPSFGGNISALIAYQHPDVFGNCGIQSGAFWPNNNEAFNLITGGPVQPIRFASIWGSYEGSITTNMRNFRDILIFDGYDLLWDELPEGHSWGLWRATTDAFLEFFFPTSTTATDHSSNPEIAISVYPNPFQNTVQIIGFENQQSMTEIAVYDLHGRLIHQSQEITMNDNDAVLNLEKLAPGVYFLSLRGAELSRTVSLIKTD